MSQLAVFQEIIDQFGSIPGVQFDVLYIRENFAPASGGYLKWRSRFVLRPGQ
jgi:hypothetical protein